MNNIHITIIKIIIFIRKMGLNSIIFIFLMIVGKGQQDMRGTQWPLPPQPETSTDGAACSTDPKTLFFAFLTHSHKKNLISIDPILEYFLDQVGRVLGYYITTLLGFLSSKIRITNP